MIRVGVVGTGSMGKHHPRVYSELEEAELKGIVDKNPERAEEIGTKYEVPFYEDYETLYSKVEAVSIATPTPLHKEIAIDFMNQGVHCFVEKPIASSVEEGEKMIKVAEENDVKLMVGHIERFNPAVRALKDIIKEDKLGELVLLSTRRVGPFNPRISDTGVIVDSATHDIDVARYLMDGDPSNIYTKAGSVKHKEEDHAHIVLDFGNASASIEVNWLTPHKVRTLVATGTEAIAYLDYIEQSLEILSPDEKIIPRFDKEEPLKIELQHFLDCIDEDKTPQVNGQEGLKVLEIAKKAQNVGT